MNLSSAVMYSLAWREQPPACSLAEPGLTACVCDGLASARIVREIVAWPNVLTTVVSLQHNARGAYVSAGKAWLWTGTHLLRCNYAQRAVEVVNGRGGPAPPQRHEQLAKCNYLACAPPLEICSANAGDHGTKSLTFPIWKQL